MSVQNTRNVIPKNYEEFVELYQSAIIRQVRSFNGIRPDDVHDITQDIILQFIQKDYLSIYNPHIQAGHAYRRYQEQLAEYMVGERDFKPRRHTGRFSSFIFEFVKLRLRGIRDKSNRRFRYEGVSLDATISANADEDGSEFINAFGKSDDAIFTFELKNYLIQMYRIIRSHTSPTETRNLPELFERIINEGIANREGFDRSKYANEKGITVSAVSMQLRDLRQMLFAFSFTTDMGIMSRARERYSEDAR